MSETLLREQRDSASSGATAASGPAPRSLKRPGRAARIGRVAFGLTFVLGAATHIVLGTFSPESYRAFADGSQLSFVRHAWGAAFMPGMALFLPLLIVFEATVGLLILSGGVRTRVGLWAAIAFGATLVVFGWGFATFSIPFCAIGVALVRRDYPDSVLRSVQRRFGVVG